MMCVIALHASAYLAMGQVSSPKALFSSIKVLVIEHFSGTWPQLSLQTTWRHPHVSQRQNRIVITCGGGTPTAVQLMMKVKLWSTVIVGGGETTISGGRQPAWEREWLRR